MKIKGHAFMDEEHNENLENGYCIFFHNEM